MPTSYRYDKQGVRNVYYAGGEEVDRAHNNLRKGWVRAFNNPIDMREGDLIMFRSDRESHFQATRRWLTYGEFSREQIYNAPCIVEYILMRADGNQATKAST